jgi:hypothetical protein
MKKLYKVLTVELSYTPNRYDIIVREKLLDEMIMKLHGYICEDIITSLCRDKIYILPPSYFEK